MIWNPTAVAQIVKAGYGHAAHESGTARVGADKRVNIFSLTPTVQ